MSTILIGAPQGSKTSTVGYAYALPITAIPPTDATTALPAEKMDVGFVGSDGVTLTSELETEMWKDWNLDDVIQLLQGSSSSVSCPVAGFTPEQAKVLYGADSVVEPGDGTWHVAFTGELPPHIFLVFELRGLAGHARLVAEVQVTNPGEVVFSKSAPVTHTLNAPAFKNENFVDAQNRPSYWGLYMDAGGKQTPTP